MAWILLFFAGVFEVAMAVSLKLSQGFSVGWATSATVVSGLLSFSLLGFAMRSIPMATAYGIWLGIGMVGTVWVGISVFKEPATLARLLSVLLIFVGVVGLKLSHVD